MDDPLVLAFIGGFLIGVVVSVAVLAVLSHTPR